MGPVIADGHALSNERMLHAVGEANVLIATLGNLRTSPVLAELPMGPAAELRICTGGSAWVKLNAGAARGVCPRLFACIYIQSDTKRICSGAGLLPLTHSEDMLLLQEILYMYSAGRCVMLAGLCH